MTKIKNSTLGFGATPSAIIGTLVIAFGISIVFAIPTWLLWNWLMPFIFGLTKLTLIQAWGITLLSTLLFKSRSSSSNN